MNQKQKQIIQSAVIRVGVGVLAILTGYFFLNTEEMYQKACYAFGYFFVAYTLIMETISAISKNKWNTPERLASVVAIITSALCVWREYYKTAIVIMIVAILLDTAVRFVKAKNWEPYPLYIFDLDGTIANTLESIAYTTNLVLKELELKPQPLEAYKTFVGDGAVKQLERALAAAGDALGDKGVPLHLKEAVDSYFTKFEEYCTYRANAYGGMKDTLEQLKSEGSKLAVFTNKRHSYAVKVVEEVYGKDFFDAILGEGNGFPKKPDPQGALHLAEQFGILPEHCVYVGDTNIDMKTGIAAGMYTVGVTWGFRTKSELKVCNPNAIIDTPKELLELERKAKEK